MVNIRGGKSTPVPTQYLWYVDANNYSYAKSVTGGVEIWTKVNGTEFKEKEY